MIFLGPEDDFPPVEYATADGLLAVGGELSPENVLQAYYRGIFPWYDESQPILWWSPDPRMVLFPEELRISRSMKRLLKKDLFKVSYNRAFEEVISNCAGISREGQDGTWITPPVKNAFLELHRCGFAHSVEVWQEEKLVGGLYGLLLKEKSIFCGESMFSKVSNASKFGLIKFVEKLQLEEIKLIDCQVYTPHLESLGAREIPRKDFLKFLE